MAYAAVISLKHTIRRLENSINKPQITISAHEEELNSLVSMLNRLDDRRSRCIDRRVINELDAKIREAVWKVEDVLESFHSLNISSSQGGLDEKGVEEEMNSFLKKVKILREEYYRVLRQNPSPAAEDEALPAAVPEPVNESTTVGLSDLSHKIINQLVFGIGKTHQLATQIYEIYDLSNKIILRLLPGPQSDPHFVSVVGMAGIGKTHLAALIYHHPRILQHFHVRLWVTAGPKYQEKVIFADILSQLLHKPRDLFKDKSEDTLIHLIGSSLGGRRYFIVLDDIWTAQVFDYISLLHFVDHRMDSRKDSRFLITTRLQEVATNRVHEMPFLNNNDSWNLLWRNVFAEESFPPQLEKPGRKIAEKCEGLPLLILAVANILCGLDKTEEYWMKVAENKTTTFTDAYDNIYEILLLSYDYLPQHLKACFLYMGVFPQSSKIPLTKLINLWDVEDILEQMEMFAIKCMEDLVSKSLAIVCKRSFGWVRKIKSSKLHSAYWYLCVKEARKSKLFHVLNKLTDVHIERPRRLAVQNNVLLGLKEVYDSMAAITSTTRSLLCTGEDHQYPVRICFNMMLLMRVLDALAIRFYEFPEEVVKLLELRYLSLTHNGELPSSISKLRRLWCLILRRHHNIKLLHRASSLPYVIWDMHELRHLWIMGSNLLDPRKGAQLPKLLRLYVNANSCTEAVFRSIPNLEKLGITIELEPDTPSETVRCFEHIKLLTELESLKCVVVNPRLRSQLVVAPPEHLSNLFVCRLKKLSLNGLGYPWKYMTAIGSLISLEVLKLRCSAFQGAEWETKVGQFKSLKYLLLEDIDLVHWTAQGSRYDECFRNLRHLSVRHCYKLKKIPSEIGDISTLEMMEVHDCSPSVVASAHQIKLKTKYSHLQVVINSSWNL